MIKSTYFIPNASILFNGKRLLAFPLKSRERLHFCLPRPYSRAITLPYIITKDKSSRGIRMGKEVKLSLFADIIIYIWKPPENQ